ncbi:hypothetical protein [Paraflavitalea sp. CAU 1676]|uniref:hypothetical protein n=1 Tax=Paraflavitalea sp. CAU 1676 TaxID=3032598 RepID=UPI0023DAEDA6|nr:hypothetical protein [Paraflavitalea sp. CAU 1676]MDF2188606.1 hypothetical protein [Paraflavitalea sp. CAU 1676]
MARYYGPVEIRGSIGGMTYYTNEEGRFAKEKSSPRKHRMKHGEEFMVSRRYSSEFRGATAVTQQLCAAMGNLKKGVRSMRQSSRITAWLLGVAHTDPVSDWGERKVWLGDLSQLQGFDFNHQLALDDALPVNLWNSCRVEAGKAIVQMPGFRLRRKKMVPKDATHFRMVSAVIYLDAGKKTFRKDQKSAELCAIGNKQGPAFEVEHTIEAGAHQLLFWLVGIEYYGLNKKNKLDILKGGAVRVMGCGLGGLVDYKGLASAGAEELVIETGQKDVKIDDKEPLVEFSSGQSEEWKCEETPLKPAATVEAGMVEAIGSAEHMEPLNEAKPVALPLGVAAKTGAANKIIKGHYCSIRISGQIGLEAHEAIRNVPGFEQVSFNEMIVYCDYSDYEIPVGYVFRKVISSTGQVIPCTVQLVAVTQQFAKPMDGIPRGWKSICKLSIQHSTVPALLANIPVSEDWHNQTDQQIMLSGKPAEPV